MGLNFKTTYKVLVVMESTVQYLDCGGEHMSLSYVLKLFRTKHTHTQIQVQQGKSE